ncbi:MAG: rhomboid family intramembrane serine protease [archaeon]
MVRIYTVAPKRRGFFSSKGVNFVLILINVVLFFILKIIFPDQMIIIEGETIRTFHPFILKNIAISLENISELRVWTFLTSMFMHGSIFHLFANMLSLFFIGGLVEKLLGRKRYLWFYLISGLFAGALYILVELLSPYNLPAVGASGAIFGLIGLLMILTPNLPVYLMFIPIPIKMKYAAPGILVVLWLISLAGNIPIGNTAHLGGFVLGLAYAFYLRKKYKNKTRAISRHFS